MPFILLLALSAMLLIVGCTREAEKTDACTSKEIVENHLKSQGVRKCEVKELGKYTGREYKIGRKDEYNLFDVDEEYYLIKDISDSTAFHIDQDDVLSYSLTIVKNFEELAGVKGLSLEEYFGGELKVSEKQFYSLCHEMGELDIKKKLLVGNIAVKEGICIGEKETSDFCNANQIDEREITDKRERSEIYYKVLEKKVIKYLLKNNIVE